MLREEPSQFKVKSNNFDAFSEAKSITKSQKTRQEINKKQKIPKKAKQREIRVRNMCLTDGEQTKYIKMQRDNAPALGKRILVNLKIENI